MRVAFIGEGAIDNVLIPPLLTTIARTKAQVNWPIDFDHDIRRTYRFGMGYGEVVKAVRKFVELLDQNPQFIKKQFQRFIVLLDGAGTIEAQSEIRALISQHPEFIFGIATKEVEAWVLADREHVIEWLDINRKSAPACRFWQSGYDPERDPDPKETLTQLLRSSSKTDFDVWCEGAAEEFVDLTWKGTDISDHYVDMDEWTGRADLRLMAEKCPQGFAPFERSIMQMLGK